MPTYQDVTGRIRALIGDNPNHYADDNFLLTYVNMAQGQLVSELVASGIREAMFKASMLVPSSTSRIERWPSLPTLPNETAYSDAFSLAAAPSGWAVVSGTGPTVSSGIADPDGGTLAKRWSFAGTLPAVLYAGGYEVGPTLSFFGSASLWLKSADAVAPVGALLRVGMADDNGPISETMESLELAVTSEWQRVHLGFQSKNITATPVGALRRCAELTVRGTATVTVDLFRLVIRPTWADTDDVLTAGNASIAGRIPVLPRGILMPDRVLERRPASSEQWLVMRGPIPISQVLNAERLIAWDWRNGGIDLNPCLNDREIMVEYWGEMQDGQLGANVIEEELPITGSLEPLACIAAGLLSQGRDQHGAAERFGVMQRDGGFSGAAGGLVTNLVATFRKARQSEPIRRQPYFGYSRYPGVSGNVIGAFPWNTN
jgi:hypothetical protein